MPCSSLHSSPLHLYTFALPGSLRLWQHSHFCPPVVLAAFPPCFQSNKWQPDTCVCGCVCGCYVCVCMDGKHAGGAREKRRSGTTEEWNYANESSQWQWITVGSLTTDRSGLEWAPRVTLKDSPLMIHIDTDIADAGCWRAAPSLCHAHSPKIGIPGCLRFPKRCFSLNYSILLILY